MSNLEHLTDRELSAQLAKLEEAMATARYRADGSYEAVRAEWGRHMDERIRRFTADMSPEERARKAAGGVAAAGRILSAWQDARARHMAAEDLEADGSES